MFDNRTSALRREIYNFHASAVPGSSYLDRLLEIRPETPISGREKF